MAKARQSHLQVNNPHGRVRAQSDGKNTALEIRMSAMVSPEEFEHYDRTLPGAADRLLGLVEQEQAHRHAMELKDQDHQHIQERKGLRWGGALTLTGMILAALILLGIGAGGVWLLLNGKDVAGLAALISAIASALWVFVKLAPSQKRQAVIAPERTQI